MITLNIDLTAGAARLTQTATIKTGAHVPVRVIFAVAPGEVSALQFALGSDGASPTILAYAEDFIAENETTWTAVLNAGDSRLVSFLSGKSATSVSGELVTIVDGVRQVTPDIPITIQPAIINGTDTAPTGPGITITDGSDGHIYRLVSNGGVLGLEQVS